MTFPDAKRLKDLKVENARLKRLLAESILDTEALRSLQAPQQMRETARMMQQETKISERRACQLLGLSRTVLHYESKAMPENEQLQARLIELAVERRRFGYRRLHVLVRREGVQANHKRFTGCTVVLARPFAAGRDGTALPSSDRLPSCR